MQKIIYYIALFLFFTKSHAQGCSTYSDIHNPDLPICKSDSTKEWTWEILTTNPDFCKMWHASIHPELGYHTSNIGSPFMNSTPGKLYKIFIEEDYTRSKGWYLIERDFGCQNQTHLPYFILYNDTKNICRIFVYPVFPLGATTLAFVLQRTNLDTSTHIKLAETIEMIVDDWKKFIIGDNVHNVYEIELNGPYTWTYLEINASNDPDLQQRLKMGKGLSLTLYPVYLTEYYPPSNRTIDVHTYPNPSNGIVEIVAERDILENTYVTVYDALGRKIENLSNQIINQKEDAADINFDSLNQVYKTLDLKHLIYKYGELNLSSLANGIYFLHLKTSETTFIKKIIIQH
jgi:hypothetical protein